MLFIYIDVLVLFPRKRHAARYRGIFRIQPEGQHFTSPVDTSMRMEHPCPWYCQ